MTASIFPQLVRSRLEALPTHPPQRRRAPRATADGPAPHAPEAPGAGPAVGPGPAPLPRNLVGLTILVVDDDEASLDYFEVALRTCGAVVVTASGAIDALRVLQEQRPNAVLSDIAMRGRDGYWLVREIRALAQASLRGVPVVATTAFGEHSRARTAAAGFAGHLPKPVDPELLCRTMGRVLGR